MILLATEGIGPPQVLIPLQWRFSVRYLAGTILKW